MASRHALLPLLIAVAAASGCRAYGTGNLNRPDPVAIHPKVDVHEVIARHNTNASRITTFEARPGIVAKSLADQQSGGLRGRMAMERPRNFRLNIESRVAGTLADFGSNESEFWFWVKPWKDQTLYVCNYDDAGESPLAVTYQPDWILEALGLKEIPEEQGDGPARREGENTILSRRVAGGQGRASAIETVISPSGQITEYRLYSLDPKTLVARAQIIGPYQSYPVASTGGDGAEAPVSLPKAVRLTWTREKFQLDVTLGEVKINAPIAAGNRFTEPVINGVVRKDLKEAVGIATDAPTTTVRETMPAPPSDRVRLGEPEPLGAAERDRGPLDPSPLTSTDLEATPAPADSVIKARAPRPGSAEARSMTPFPEFTSER